MIIPVVFFMLQSHTIGEGPVFSKHAFNANGMSPLVAQFKRMHHLSPQAGQSVLLSRTEIDSFPPLDKQTYDDFLRKSFQKMHERQHNCRRWTIKKNHGSNGTFEMFFHTADGGTKRIKDSGSSCWNRGRWLMR